MSKKKNNTEPGDEDQSKALMMADQSYQDDNSFDLDLNIFELVQNVWNNKRTIIKSVIITVVVGICIALLTKNEYRSSTHLMPEYSTQGQSGASGLLKQYGSLLGLGGGTYNSSSNAIRVDLYPKIAESVPFVINLLEQETYFAEFDTTIAIENYFTELYSPGIASRVIGGIISIPKKLKKIILMRDSEVSDVSTGSSLEDSEILNISKERMELIKNFKSRIEITLEETSGIVKISAVMPEPIAAANVTKLTLDNLTDYLIEYRTEKGQRDLKFIEEQLAKAETRFENAQLDLAGFRDSNQGILTERARTEEQNLNSEYNIAFNLYNSLTQQHEEALLKIQEETPLFKVLQPVQVPVNKDNMSKTNMVIISAILGFFIGFCIVVIRYFLFEFKIIEKLKSA